MASSSSGVTALATRYIRSRQLQKLSSLDPRNSVSPAKARWNACECRLVRPGTHRSGRRGHALGPRRSGVTATQVAVLVPFEQHVARPAGGQQRVGGVQASVGHRDHRQVQVVLARARDGLVVARIGMPHHAGGRIVPQHARQPRIGLDAAVAHDHHAGVLREAHAHAAAVVQRHPGGARGAVEQRVQQRPVGHRVRSVAHRLGFAVGRGDRSRVEMIAANHDRRREFARAHHRVEGQPQAMAIAQPHPADARRQALHADALAGHVEPADAGACRGA